MTHRHRAPPLAADMAPVSVVLPAAITPEFLAAEITEMRRHLAILRRHTRWLAAQLAELRGDAPPNVRQIRPGYRAARR
jgi:hypothetical protein